MLFTRPRTGERNRDEASDGLATGCSDLADRTRRLRSNCSCLWPWWRRRACSSHERATHLDINIGSGARGSCSDDCSARGRGHASCDARALTEATTGDAAVGIRNVRHHAAVSPRSRRHDYRREFIAWRSLPCDGDWAGGRFRAHHPRPCWNLRIGEQEHAPCGPRHRDCGQPRSDRFRHNRAAVRLRCRAHRDRVRQRAASPHHRLRHALTRASSGSLESGAVGLAAGFSRRSAGDGVPRGSANS